MKKNTIGSVMFSALLTSFVGFGQGTGTTENTDDLAIGIQNNYGIEDSRSAEIPSVLIAGAPGNPDWILDVEAQLDGTGIVAADTFLTSAGTPTLAELQSYDAVLIFTDTGAADPMAFGDNLGQYIDGGGAVVDATFTPIVSITGGFTAYELYSAAGQSNGTNLGIGTILEPGHPTLNGVSTFDGGTASFHNTGGTIAAGASIVAEYTTGAPFIIVQQNVGPGNARRTFLNFYPPSIDARDDFWDVASDGALIMANSLRWTAGFADGVRVLVAGSPGNPDWILDVEQKLESTGEISADTFLTSGGTPTLAQLQEYEAVYVFTDAGAADPEAFGNILGQYIDAGGAVVDATFTPNVPITGGFTAYELYSAAGQTGGTNLGLGTILEPGHPILTDVNTFDGGTASFHNTGGTVAAGATVIAEYTDSSPFAIRQSDLGPSNARRVFLNFYPPSIDARDDFWDTASDGAQVMINALLWAADANTNDGPTVLVVGSPGNPDWIDDVEDKLEEAGNMNADTFLSSGGTPTLAQLQEYDAVYLFTDAGAADPSALGNVLEQYIDSGFPVVDATFTPNVPITGGFTQYELYSAAVQNGGANLGIGSILEPGDPILTDVNTFDGGTSSFHNTGGTITTGAVVVAEYTDGSPLIIRAENVGPANTRRVFLNFYPPSIDVRDDFWDTASDGAQLMRNALLWAINGILSTDDNQIALDISVYPNPASSQIAIAGNFEIETVEVYNLLGQKVMTSTSKILNIEELTTAMYILNITDNVGNRIVKRFIKK
jgi:adenosylcobinamide amidohydrolase